MSVGAYDDTEKCDECLAEIDIEELGFTECPGCGDTICDDCKSGDKCPRCNEPLT